MVERDGGRTDRLLRGLGRTAEVGAYLFWLAVDAAEAPFGGQSLPWNTLPGLVVAVVVLARGRIGRDRAAVAACLVSLGCTVVAPLSRGTISLVLAEQLALAVVAISAVQRAGPRRAGQLVAVSGLAIVGSAAVRVSAPVDRTAIALSVMGWIGAAAIGLALREGRSRREAQLADARTAERMELARELHDVVAHHVTGIVVAAQAAAVVARTKPDEVDRALESIERAGSDALTAMRRMVSVLRGQAGHSDATRSPGPDLAGVDDLVRRFDDGRGTTRLHTDPSLRSAELPAGVAASAYRIVQEALTNVRRHAPKATSVEVGLRAAGEDLLVTVRNDGVDPRPDRGGGFGLAGMSERVQALGGDLSAGPAPDGVWTVRARLPLRGPR